MLLQPPIRLRGARSWVPAQAPAFGAIIGAATGTPGLGAAIGAGSGALLGGLAGAAHAENIKNQRAIGQRAPAVVPPNTFVYSPYFQNGLWYCNDNNNHPWWWDETSEQWRY